VGELRFSLVFSILFHAGFIYVAAIGLPYFSRDLPTIERPIPVELLNIEDITRIKEPEPEPEVQQAIAEPVQARPQPPTETVVPNPDLKPKPKPDKTELERKKLVANVTPNTKPRPPTSFDPGQISALIDKSLKDKPQQQTPDREKELEEAVNNSRISGLQANRNTATIQDFIRDKMRECWTAPVGAVNISEMIVVIRFSLNPEGFLMGPPKLQNQTQIFASNDPFYRAAAEGALRAVRLCEPYELPREIYDQWKELELNFDPSDMVG
jgi:hypothetical protein